MKVKELIAELRQFDDDAKVHLAYPSGDYWRTSCAPTVESVEEGIVKYSEYHRIDQLDEKAMDRYPAGFGHKDDEEKDKSELPRFVVVLS